MTEKITLKAKKRTILGRKVKQLRRQDILPANLYGKKIKSKSLQLNAKEFNKVFNKAGETSVVYLNIEDSKNPRPVLINNIHLHPVSDLRLHVDFRQVDLTQKVKVNVPVDLQGESLAVNEGAVLVQQFNELEIEALPSDIPDSIIFDLSKLKQTGNSLKLSDAKVNKNVVFELEPDTIIALIQEARQEEEPAPSPAEGEDKPEDSKEDSKTESPSASKDKPGNDKKEEK